MMAETEQTTTASRVPEQASESSMTAETRPKIKYMEKAKYLVTGIF
jgi:hypothetical protein